MQSPLYDGKYQEKVVVIRMIDLELNSLRFPILSGLEYWNDGTMGSGKMGQWFIGKIPIGMEGVNTK